MNAPQFQQGQPPQQGYPQPGYGQQPQPMQPQPMQGSYPQQGYATQQGYAPQQGYPQPAAQMAGAAGYPQQVHAPQQYGSPQQVYAPRQPVSVAGAFVGIENVRGNLRTQWMAPGRYWLRIDVCKFDMDRFNVRFWAIEMTIIKVLDNAQGQGHAVGTAVCRMCKQNKNHFMPELKSFISGVLGVPDASITQQDCERIFGPDQPLTGTVVEANVWTQTAQTTGRPFTKVAWVREVRAAELISALDPNAQMVFFPNNALQLAHAHDQKTGRAVAGMAPAAPMQAPQPGQQGYAPQPGPATMPGQYPPVQQAPAQPQQPYQPQQGQAPPQAYGTPAPAVQPPAAPAPGQYPPGYGQPAQAQPMSPVQQGQPMMQQQPGQPGGYPPAAWQGR